MANKAYTKLFSLVDENATKEARYTVSLETEDAYREKLYIAPSGEFERTYGEDLSVIFAPWRSGPEGNFDNPSGLGPSGNTNQHPLYPFRYDPNADEDLYNLGIASGMDTLYDVVSSDDHYLGPQFQRDISDTRGIGLRGPIIIVGWGYDGEGNPVPSGEGSGLFAGEYENGYEVDPAEYVAAPLDVRYDHESKTWKAISDGLPPGGQNFMVLQKQNGIARWDWTRAHNGGWEPE